MNGLAYEHYVVTPWLLFQGWPVAAFHQRLAQAVDAAALADRELDALTVARLRWYPVLTSEFIVSGKISRTDIDAILNTPARRFAALANHYTALAPTLEAKLLEDPESVERLVRWLRYTGKQSFRPEAEYLASLGDDPNRHMRLTPPAERPDREQLNALAQARKYSHPAWAFLYVSCNSLSSLDPELVAALSQSEEYAYLAALVLRKRGLDAGIWGALLPAINSERWAFHAMADLEPGSRISNDERNRLLRIVHRSPPWAVQLWEKRGWSDDQLEWAYSECIAYSDTHECAPELRAWHRFVFARTGSARRQIAA